MAIDFEKLIERKLTPEQLAERRELRADFEIRQAEFGQLADDDLCNTAEYYLAQMRSPLRFAAGEYVYDAVMWHVILPELLNRLRGKGSDG